MDRQIGRPAFEAEELLARVGDDLDLLRDIYHLLAEDSPLRLAELHAAIAANNPRMIAAATHYLKGAASNFAARRAVALAERVERLAEDADHRAQQLAARDLESEISRLLAELDAFLEAEFRKRGLD